MGNVQEVDGGKRKVIEKIVQEILMIRRVCLMGEMNEIKGVIEHCEWKQS